MAFTNVYSDDIGMQANSGANSNPICRNWKIHDWTGGESDKAWLELSDSFHRCASITR